MQGARSDKFLFFNVFPIFNVIEDFSLPGKDFSLGQEKEKHRLRKRKTVSGLFEKDGGFTIFVHKSSRYGLSKEGYQEYSEMSGVWR